MPLRLRRLNVCFAQSTAGRWRCWYASSVTSTWPRRRSRTRSRPPWSAGQRPGCLRARPDGSSPPPVTGRSTAFAARRLARAATPRPRSDTPLLNRLVREELCAEAIRLGRLLVQLLPDEPEVMGLLALMVLIESRRASRTTSDGDLVLLAEQDRGRWDRDLIAEGQAIVRRCLDRNKPGPYQLQAAINAVHSDAADAPATDWWQILQLYNQLLSIDPSPVVALNRAVAVAEVEGPDAALTLLDGLELDRYHLFHAIRADLLRRIGRNTEAVRAYEMAIARAANAAEREFLRRRHQALIRTSVDLPQGG